MRIVDGIITVSDKYPELKEAVDSIVADHVYFAQENGDSDVGEYRITRFDDKCLSFVHTGRNRVNDFINSVQSYNLRLDGTKIQLNEVIKDINCYCRVGASFIDSNYPNMHLFFSDKDTYGQLKEKISNNSYCLNNGALLIYGDYLWVGIPYKPTADLLNPEFLPDDGNCFGISNSGIIEHEDDVYISNYDDYYSLEYCYATINGVKLDYVEDFRTHGYSEPDGFFENCYTYYLRTGTGVYVYLYCFERIDDVDEQVEVLYDITDGTPVFLYGSNNKSSINDAEDLMELVVSCT